MEQWLTPLLRQTWAVSGVLINTIGLGMIISYPSSLLPGLRHPDSTIKLTLDSGTMLSSAIGVSNVLGYIISSIFMDWKGRRIAFLLLNLPGVIGWLLIYFSSTFLGLLIGRIFTGVTVGSGFSIGTVVIAEYSTPKHRGMFLNLKTTAVCIGGMIVHILQNYLSWRTIALITSIVHILAELITLTWPESPFWLASTKQFEKCKTSFLWLRGNDQKSIKELEELIKLQIKSTDKENQSFMIKTQNFFLKLKRKDFVKPMFQLILAMLLMEICGRHFFPAYATDIIGGITGNETKSFYYILCLDLIICISSFCSSFLVKIMKRRTLLFATGIMSIIVIFIVCTYLLLVFKEIISKDYPIVPLSLIVVYFVLVNLGCVPISLLLAGELLPFQFKETGAAVAGIFVSLYLYLFLKIPPYLLVSINVHGLFMVCGVMTAIVLLILYYTLPETKDKTLQEIDGYFCDNKNIENEEEIEVMINKELR